jgi:hypothetical protein
MADRYLIRDLTAPAGYVINMCFEMSSFICSVQVPENVQKKLAQNEKLRKLKAEAIENKVKVCES